MTGNAFIGLAVLGNALVSSCAPATRYEQPSALRGYDILITRRDSLGRELAQGLKRRGFTVRQHVRGGGRATAYLFAFIFRETDPPALTWLHVRLADTRTGVVVAAVSAPLDSLGARSRPLDTPRRTGEIPRGCFSTRRIGVLTTLSHMYL
jgi:hypothetical protein